MNIASKVANKLKSNGVKVKLTREENDLTSDELLDEYGTHGRAVIPGEVHAKYTFSFHMNSSPYSSVNGLEIYTARNINYDFVKSLANNLVSNTGINYSANKQHKMYNGVYSRNFTNYDIEDAIATYKKKGLISYDLTTESNYYYMIRETGGIITRAYVDDRNKDANKNAIPGNPYYSSNTGTETYLLELGYITSPTDRNNMKDNMNKYVDSIVNSFMEIYKIKEENN